MCESDKICVFGATVEGRVVYGMVDYYLLPSELWLEILSWATQPSSNDPDTRAITYVPFQSAPADTKDSTLSVKRTLTLVCRLWRIWMIGSLYREIKIQYGAHALQHMLECMTSNHEGYGRLVRILCLVCIFVLRVHICPQVRRAVLPYLSTVSSPDNSPISTSLKILRMCSHLEVLVRPRSLAAETLRFDYEVDCVQLPSLRRLEWWHHTEAERSGGINSLGIVLQHAPNIEYLFIGGVVGYIQLTHVCLPLLRTLRLHAINGLLLHQITTKWDLPSMTHIVFYSPLVEQGLQRIWDRFGEQLEVVEFGKHLRFMMGDHLTICLQGCPALQEIGYNIFFTKVPGMRGEHARIKTVRLHSAINSFLQTAEQIWSILEGHFRFFNQLPALNKIVLHGEWRGILGQHHFQALVQQLRETKSSVIFELGNGSSFDRYSVL